jgi:amino acid adenylation domain-containing protein
MKQIDSVSDRFEEYLRDTAARGSSRVATIPRRDPQAWVPLSLEQEQVWLHAQIAGDVPLYNEVITVIHRGSLNVAAFERAFNEILRRHEAWRTSIHVRDGQPYQVVEENIHVSLPERDLRYIPLAHREAAALRIATDDARKPIDLSKAPLLRCRLIRFGDAEHRLYLTLSHIIFDGVSIYRVLLPELDALHRAFSAGKPSPLPELVAQYPDYACWQRSSPHSEGTARDLEYWRRQLAGEIPELLLPADRRRTAALSFRGAMHPFALSSETTAKARALGSKLRITTFQMMLAAFAALLCRYSGQSDIPIGSVIGGRNHPATTEMIGYFLNTILLRIDLSGNPSFQALLERVRNVTLEALDYGSVSFGQLIQELHIPRDLSRNPLFQVMFTLEPPLSQLDSEWDLSQSDVDTCIAKYDIYFELDERRENVLTRFHYSTDLFDARTVERMAAHWTTLLADGVTNPHKRISELAMLSEGELKQLSQWNRTEQPCPAVSIHALFEAQVDRTPAAIAAVFGEQQLTYRELNARANQLARYLRSVGVGPETLVGVCVERTLDLVIVPLAILKAGGAYLPLDSNSPAERLALILGEARPRMVLTNASLRDRLPVTDAAIAVLDDLEFDDRFPGDENPASAAEPGNLAYVMYTSGSTGMPKGVQIEHRNVVNFLGSMQREPGIYSHDALLAVTSLSFDIAGLEIFLPLISGARVVVAPEEAVADGMRLMALIRQANITVMQATPSTWRLLIDAGWQSASELTVLCGGEALTPELASDLTHRCRSVWNVYGPTETTIWSTIHRITKSSGDPPSIGRPIANTQVYVLDANMNLLPLGVAGDLYIGGAGLARGYLHRPELTLQTFVSNPFSRHSEARLYRTGDRVRRLSDGNIEFLGRTDGQVKIRGHRIELGEVEAALAAHPYVKEAAAIVREETGGTRQLVAYAVAHHNREIHAGELRSFLREKLPEYMLPARLVIVDRFPLTATGKLDRRALPAPNKESHEASSVFIAGRDEWERRLTEIWEDVLGLKPIGIRDDFFAIGGHSLSAMRVFALIEKSFGRRFSLATLIKAPTIELLAEVLRAKTPSNGAVSLVPIQSGGTAPPLFCVHGHYGDVLFYRFLSQHLGSEQPFFALQARGIAGFPPHHSVQDMAADYLKEVQNLQPKGPYYLGGYCFGARVVLEMAHMLRAQGEQVAFLGFFIDYDPEFRLLDRLRSRLQSHCEQFQQLGLRAKLACLGTNVSARSRSLLWRLRYKLMRNYVSPESPLFRNIPEMNLQVLRKYAPRPYPGRITVFLAGTMGRPTASVPKPNLYGMSAKDMEVRVIPRDRGAIMVHEPFVGVLANHLSACLKLARNQAEPWRQ